MPAALFKGVANLLTLVKFYALRLIYTSKKSGATKKAKFGSLDHIVRHGERVSLGRLRSNVPAPGRLRGRWWRCLGVRPRQVSPVPHIKQQARSAVLRTLP